MTTLDFELDPASAVPLYRQIAEQVRRRIALGALRGGDRLPTVRELAVQARVNRNTAARAIQELESEGAVRTRVGQGTFVADAPPRLASAQRGARLDRALDEVLFEARRLGVPLDDVGARLERRIAAFRQRQRRSSGPQREGGNEE